jgi:DNA-binding response OmpR family regulator
MLSARGQARDVEEGLASGARAYVVKPFSPRDLVARVAELLGGRPPDEPGGGSSSSV